MKKTALMLVLMLSLAVVFASARSQDNALISLYPDGNWEWTNGSPTPVVITAEPGSTQTPWIITATPDTILTDTPTPEIQPTFTPTNTPDPLCLLQNRIGTVRVRDLPSTENTLTLGYTYQGDYIHPLAYYEDSIRKWYRITWDENTEGWTADTTLYTYISGDCEGLLYENPF